MDPFASGVAELEGHVDRLADRLRALSEVRLARPLPPFDSRADAAHDLAQRLADDSARLEGAPVRPVPRLHDLAVGDQVAVAGHDLVAAAGAAHLVGGAGVLDLVAEASLACQELTASL